MTDLVLWIIIGGMTELMPARIPISSLADNRLGQTFITGHRVFGLAKVGYIIGIDYFEVCEIKFIHLGFHRRWGIRNIQ